MLETMLIPPGPGNKVKSHEEETFTLVTAGLYGQCPKYAKYCLLNAYYVIRWSVSVYFTYFTKSDDSDPVQLFRRLAVGTWHPLIDGYPTGIEDDDGKEGRKEGWRESQRSS